MQLYTVKGRFVWPNYIVVEGTSEIIQFHNVYWTNYSSWPHYWLLRRSDTILEILLDVVPMPKP